MSMSCFLFNACGVVLILAACVPAQTADLIQLEQEAVRTAAAHVAPSVVQIETLGGLEKVSRVLIGTGPTSGLIVSEDGYIISSAFNFIQQPASILVTLPDGQRRPATIVARDRSRMLVLLRVSVEGDLVVPVPAPSDELRVGQTVIALGKTFDAEQANLSVGILSATNRIWGKAVQTDAKVSPANYGGPLIDLQGRVIGVLVPLSPESDDEVAGAEWYDSGIGFAIPLGVIQERLDQLKDGQDLLPGKLGFAFEDASQLDPETKIAVVKANSPAAQVGLQPGDRVLAVNGHPVERHSQVRHQLGPLYAGDVVSLTVQRGAETLELEATLTDSIPPYEHAFLGILPQPNDPQPGVVVRYIFPASPAAELGLKIDDRLLQLDEQPIENANQLRMLLATFQPGQTLRLKWQRGGETQSGELNLQGLPEDVPDSFPAIATSEPRGDLPTGQIAIEIPEEPNRCTALVPESLQSGPPGGLLVLLPEPGESKLDELIAAWQDTCEANRLVLLLPEPQDASRWQPTEVGYVRKVIDHAIDRFGLNKQQIAVLGEEAGGAMSYLVGFRHRDVVRGIAAIDAPIPGRLGGIENEPLQRLAILTSVCPASENNERIEAGVKAFRELKFPVTELRRDEANSPISDIERAMIGRWVVGLDRL